MIFSHLLTKNKAVYRTKHEYVARYISESISSVCGVMVDFIKPKTAEHDIYLVSIPYEADRVKVMTAFGYSGREINSRINFDIMENDCCKSAFLRGAFIACGNISEPRSSYHLEFVPQHKQLCGDLAELLSGMNMPAGTLVRKSIYVVYFKSAECIEKIMSLIGAKNAAEAIRTIIEERNRNNLTQRMVNCDNANIQKTVNASVRQTEAIRIIEKHKGLSSLPKELYEVALLRLENPEMTLSDMCAQFSGTVTRSQINHRLKKLIDYSEQLQKKE